MATSGKELVYMVENLDFKVNFEHMIDIMAVSGMEQAFMIEKIIGIKGEMVCRLVIENMQLA